MRKAAWCGIWAWSWLTWILGLFQGEDMSKSSGGSIAEWLSAWVKDCKRWDLKNNKAPERLCSNEMHLWNMCQASKISLPPLTEPRAESALSSWPKKWSMPQNKLCKPTTMAFWCCQYPPKQEGHHGHAVCLEVAASLGQSGRMPRRHYPFCKRAVEPVVFPAFIRKLFKISDGK